MRRTFVSALFVIAALALLGTVVSWAAPARDLMSIKNGQTPAPILQWFLPTGGAEPVSSRYEFYDNITGEQGDISAPWGGAASWHAIGGRVTQVTLGDDNSIKGFKVRAWVTNDLYNYQYTLLNTGGSNSHGQSAGDINGQSKYRMVDVRLSASFADDGKLGNQPNAAPFNSESNIYAMNPDSLAWFCYDPRLTEPPVPQTPAGYWVPTWNFTGAGISDSGMSPQVILPGETHSRDLEFGCYVPILPGSADWSTVMGSYQQGTELLLNRTSSLKISDYPDVLSADPGTMSIQSPGHASDCSVFFNQPRVGSLTFNYAGIVPSHFWWPVPGGNPDNLMFRGVVTADPNEAVRWDNITLKALGTGNDATDIDQVRIWADVNNNGIIEPAIDQIVGLGTYAFDNAVLTISLAPAPVIPAGGTLRFLISYVMNTSVMVMPGRTYSFEASSAAGTGEISGASVPVSGFSLNSCVKVRGKKPIKIGQAKLPLPPGDPVVLLEDEVITADFQTRMGLFYIEENDRSAGIGVQPLAWIGPFSIGAKVSVLGHLQLLDGAELVLVPEYTIFAPGDPVKPLGMNNRNSGGGVYGNQPAVVSNAWAPGLPTMSCGLNSIGLLVRMWGKPTFKQNPYYLSATNPANMTWIDDGSLLQDGFLTPVQRPIAGVGVWLPPLYAPPDGYWAVTGILRAIRGPMGLPVRILVPRDESDITKYPI